MLQVLSIILAVLSTLFAIFLFTVKTKNKLGSILLGSYFFMMAIDFSAYLELDLPLNIVMLRNDIVSLISRPLIYLYVLSVIYNDFKLRKKHLLHLSWLALALIIMTPLYIADDATKIRFLSNYLDNKAGAFLMPFSMIHTQFYLILIFVTLRNYKKTVLQNFSNANLTNYKWLLQMAIMLQILFWFVFTKNMMRMFSHDFMTIEYARIAMVLFIILFLCWLLLKALHAPEIFRGIDSKLRLIRNITEEEKKEMAMQNNIEELRNFMKEKEPYLNPNLTIQNLADELGKPVRELSILINYNFKQHFYDFINSYRIDKAKELLKNTSSKDLMVFEIFYDVGFNSKSSFNTAFKKQVGKTPTQYRKTS